MPAHQDNSKLVPLGILLMLLGMFGPSALLRISAMTGMGQQVMLFALIVDGLRLGFFVGLGMLIIGLLRNRRRDAARKTTE